MKQKNKKLTKKIQETIELRGQRWLVVSKIEFWLGMLPAIFVVAVIAFSLLFLHPAFSIVLGPAIMMFYTPLAYFAWVIAIIDFVAVLRTLRCREELKVKIVCLLLPVSIILLGISSIAVTRGNFFYAIGAAAVAGVVRICFRAVSRRVTFKATTIKVLSIILDAFLILSVIVTVGGELYYRFNTIPRRQEYTNQQQEKWRQEMERAIQPMLDEGLSETLAQMSYAYCRDSSKLLEMVDDYHALLECNSNREIYELMAINDNEASFMGFGYISNSLRVISEYSFKTNTHYLTLLFPAQSEEDLLKTYGEGIVTTVNSYNYDFVQAEVFYTTKADLRDIDLAALAFVSQDRQFGMDGNIPREQSTGLKTFKFESMEKSVAMERFLSGPSDVVSNALRNRHMEIDLDKRKSITVEDLAGCWRAP